MKTLGLIVILLLSGFVSAQNLDPTDANCLIYSRPPVNNETYTYGTDGISITSWTQKANGVQSCAAHSFIDNGKLYVWGYNSGAQKGLYDIATNTWGTSLASDVIATYASMYVFVNGKFYVFGGYAGSSYYATYRIYDPTTNTWTSKGNMPSTVCGSYWYKGGAAYIGNNKILICGGKTAGGWGGSGGASKLAVTYDVTSDSFVRIADMPAERQYFAIAPMGGKVYVMGGFDTGTTAQSTVYVYDISTNTWTTGTALPATRCYPTGITTPNGIYCIGGNESLNANGATTVYAMFVGQNTWQSDEPIPAGRGRHVYLGTTSYDIYCGGGAYTSWTALNTFWFGDGKSVGFKDGMAFYKIPGNSRLAKLAPNPWHEAISVKVFFDARAIGKNASISVYDVTGHCVYTSSSTRSSAGYATYSVGKNFTPGTYTFSLKVDGKSVDVKRAVKL